MIDTNWWATTAAALYLIGFFREAQGVIVAIEHDETITGMSPTEIYLSGLLNGLLWPIIGVLHIVFGSRP